jgi:DNA-binding response OmpR family regulator
VRKVGKIIRLGPIGFRLLELFLRSPARTWTRHELLVAVWGPASGRRPRTVDGHVSCLRAALESSRAAELIRTVRGRGYSLR